MATLSDAEREALNNLKIQQELEALNKRINHDFTGYLNAKRELYELEKEIRDNEIELAKLAHITGDDTIDSLREQHELNKAILAAKKEELKNVSMLKLSYKAIEKSSMALFSGTIVHLAKYILDADKAFKSLNMEIGFSDNRSKVLLGNLIDASTYAARMGVSFEELTKVQGAYTDEMGRAVLLTSGSLQNIIDIGKGTKLGLDVAAKMAAKFNLMGKSVKSTKEFYESAVNSSIRFGVSVEKVLKTFNDNFDKSQGYVFKGGVDGLRKMSQFATKFKVDMSSVFNAMDKANGLEGAVDMAAQLQVLGGKFAAQDPFKLLHQARTDGEAFTRTMQGLTKGMATWNRTSGTFEIQAGDLNRLKLAAEATGMSYETLIAQAKQGAQMDSIFKSLSGSGLSKEAKEFVQGVAEIQKDGSFKIQLPDGSMRDIRNTTNGQINALMASNKSLSERALQAQAFDEMFKNTLNELKTTLLPILKQVQSATKFLADNRGLAKALVGFGVAFLGIPAVIGSLRPWLKYMDIVKGSSLFGKGGSAAATSTTVPRSPTSGGPAGSGGPANPNAAKNMLAFGAAVLMVGGGIWLATKGIAAMATAFKDLDPEQISKLNQTLMILGTSMAVIATIGALISPAVGPMLAFGGAIALIGAGVGIAAAGIGYMAKGFGSMFESLVKVTDPKVLSGLSGLMMSMAGLGLSSMAFANPLAWVGLKVLSSTIGDISDKIREANFNSLATAGNNFNLIATAIDKINDKKLDKLLAVSQSLSGVGGLATAIASLKNIFGESLEVKFADQKVSLEIDITNNIDGTQLGSKITKQVFANVERAKKGGQS